MPQESTPRNRLDHLLPQSYLEGFIDPPKKKTLSVFSVKERRWFESGTNGVAAIKGFYDYSPESALDQTADEAFGAFEARFPNVRRKLIADGFSGWTAHRTFLLEYAQMLRARSELFREHTIAVARQSQMARIEKVWVEDGKTAIKYKPLELTEEEREVLFRNMAITTMRMEIAKGAALFAEFDWCLRWTSDSAHPVTVADDAVVVQGRNIPELEKALKDEETLIFFPICWQACLIGALGKFEKETDEFLLNDLNELKKLYFRSDRRFVYSPVELAET